MAGAGGGMTVLPQYQGDYYTLQRQQALAQALAQQATTPQQIQATGSGPYTVMPKYSIGAGLSQLGEALLAAKLGNQVSQGYQQLGQAQLGAFGGGQPQMAQGQAPQQGGQQGTAPNPFSGGQGGSPDGSGASGAPMAAPQSNVGPMNPLGMNPTTAYLMNQQAPDKYWELQGSAFKPADVVSQIRAAGIDPNSPLGKQIAQQALAKANYIAPTSIRGQFYADADGIHALPAPAPEGFQQVPDGRGGFQIVPQQGGAEAVAANAQAKASGPATYNMSDVWDPTANNGQGGYVKQSAVNQAQAAGGAPLPLRNNNPGAVSPGGAVAKYPDMQTGIAAMDQNLQSYAGKPGTDTLGGVITKWVGSAPNAPAYIADVSKRLSISPNQKVDLTNPAQRLAISSAIMLHENGSAAVFAGGGSPAPKAGPMASQPPLGTTNAANTSQNAPSQQMADTQSSLTNSDGVYQASREALLKMIDLAKNQGAGGTAARLLPQDLATKVSQDAAEYQKQHANFVAMQGKALGSGGTDAARATIDESVPTYDKPQGAKINGLNTQLQQLDLNHLKAQFLTPIYQQGDKSAYTSQLAAFNQNVTPQMVPLLTMQPGPARAAALKQAIADPQMKARLDWATQNGILK